MSNFTKISVTCNAAGQTAVTLFAGANKTRTCLLDAMATANAAGLECAQGMALPEGVDAEVARLVGVFTEATDLARRMSGNGYNASAALCPGSLDVV